MKCKQTIYSITGKARTCNRKIINGCCSRHGKVIEIEKVGKENE